MRAVRGRRKRPRVSSAGDWVCSPIVAALLDARPALSSEPRQVQVGLARLVDRCDHIRRKHSRHTGYATLTYQEIDEAVGRKRFRTLNERYRIFDVIEHWSKDHKVTKAYRRVPDITAAIERSEDWRDDESIQAIKLDGRVMRTIPRSIAAKDASGNTRQAWRGVEVHNTIRVDRAALKYVRSDWQAALIDRRRFANWSAELGDRATDVLKELIWHADKILLASRIDVAPADCVIARYRESRTGRLMGQSGSLQGVPRLVRSAALNEHWDYDVANCHPTIIAQLAANLGATCRLLEYYIAHKEEVRDGLATRVGITNKEAKTCLIAACYGATPNMSRKAKIVKKIGKEKAAELYRDAGFLSLTKELSRARDAILGQYQPINGRMINAVGKGVSAKARPAKRLAHIVQGIEVAMLRAVVKAYPYDVLLLMHDGFVSHREFDVAGLARVVFEATGFRIVFERKRLSLPGPIPKRATTKAQSVSVRECLQTSGL
jgi:hypothetical protein